MRTSIISCTLCGIALLANACKKETDPRVHPSLTFKTGTGYVSENDTMQVNDTLLIGAVIDKTEDPLISLNITRTYDSEASVSIQDVSLTGNEHVEHDHQVITRGQPGLERYTFSVLDRDGNITTKTIALTVQ
jgi:hypothetical protein